MELELTRNVSKKECPWLNKEFKSGDKVYKYTDHTYGCISHSGIACCEIEGETPFFELPKNSIKQLTKQ